METKLMKVYLDTNILIQGGHRPEHKQLKELSRNHTIILYKSYHGEIEQHGKVFPARRKRDLAMTDLYKSSGKFAEFKNADNEYEEISKQEQMEQDYWSDAVLTRAMSSFDTLVSLWGILPDYKRELVAFDELITKYGLQPMDTFHIMSAHSAGMDYLLTWDQKSFINKCKRVPWLKVKVITPKEFLSIKQAGDQKYSKIFSHGL